MKRIIQKRNDDCGVACLAMLANISYRKAMWLLHPWRLPFTKANTKSKHFKKAFNKLGLSFQIYTESSIDIRSIPNKAMLVIHNGDGAHHGVVWDPELKLILDPAKWEKSIDFYQENLFQVIEFLT